MCVWEYNVSKIKKNKKNEWPRERKRKREGGGDLLSILENVVIRQFGTFLVTENIIIKFSKLSHKLREPFIACVNSSA